MADPRDFENTMCDYGDGKIAHHTLRVEGQGILVVCTPHEKLLKAKNKKVRCRYCGVPITGDWRWSPLARFTHQHNCPKAAINERIGV